MEYTFDTAAKIVVAGINSTKLKSKEAPENVDLKMAKTIHKLQESAMK